MSQYVVRLVLNTEINTFNNIEEYQTFAKSFPAINQVFIVIAKNLAMGIMKDFQQVLTSPNTIETTMVFANLADKQLYSTDLNHDIRSEAGAVGAGLGWQQTCIELEE
jgi:hypothetical protein